MLADGGVIYGRFLCHDELSRETAVQLIGRDDWGRISRLAAFELLNESQQTVSDATLENKYQSL
jgi:hypothetical protein